MISADISLLKNKKIFNVIFFSLVSLGFCVLFLNIIFKLDVIQNLFFSCVESLADKTLNHEVWLERFDERGLGFWLFRKLDDKVHFLYKPIPLICLFLYLTWNFRENISDADKKKKFEEIFLYAFFVFFLAITFVGIYTHEPWYDEIHVWHISRKLSLPDLWTEMRYEGHFILWFLIVYPFAHFSSSGSAVFVLSLISWIANGAAVFCFFKKSPFPFFLKLLVPLTIPFLYANPVISRCYCLIPLLLILMATFYDKIDEKPVLYGIFIALLANSHMFMEGFVAVFGIYFLVAKVILPWKTLDSDRKKKLFLALSIGVAGVILAAMQVLPGFGTSTAAKGAISEYSIIANQDFEDLIPIFTLSGFNTVLKMLLGLVLLHFIMRTAFSKSPMGYVFFLIPTSFIFMMTCVVWSAVVVNRMVLWFYVLLFSLWISYRKIRAKKTFNVVFGILCLLMVNFNNNINDFNNEYSPHKAVAKQVLDNIPPSEPIFIENVWYHVFSVYLPEYKFYNYETLEPITFFSYEKVTDSAVKNLDNAQIFENIFNKFNCDSIFFIREVGDEDFEKFKDSLSEYKIEELVEDNNKNIDYYRFLKITRSKK